MNITKLCLSLLLVLLLCGCALLPSHPIPVKCYQPPPPDPSLMQPPEYEKRIRDSLGTLPQ
jgi:hypothetical protein